MGEKVSTFHIIGKQKRLKIISSAAITRKSQMREVDRGDERVRQRDGNRELTVVLIENVIINK